MFLGAGTLAVGANADWIDCFKCMTSQCPQALLSRKRVTLYKIGSKLSRWAHVVLWISSLESQLRPPLQYCVFGSGAAEWGWKAGAR
jgi:hypothetical protein